MPNDSDVFKSTLTPPNTNTEETPAGSGLHLTKVRWLEQNDPVFYQVDNQPIMDLYKRDQELASQISSNLGGWLHEHFTANMLMNDSVIPFENGIIDGRMSSADMPSTVNSKMYWQLALSRNVNVNANINVRLHYAMSTSDTTKNVALVFRYDYYEVDDILGVPSATNTLTTTVIPPTTMNQYQRYTDSILLIPASVISSSFDYVVCSLQRDVSVVNNHGGKMQIVGVTMYQ
jgi:hypothetical protein